MNSHILNKVVLALAIAFMLFAPSVLLAQSKSSLKSIQNLKPKDFAPTMAVPKLKKGKCTNSINGQAQYYIARYPIPGLEITLFSNGARRLASTRTNARGFYTFRNLCQGTYHLATVPNRGTPEYIVVDGNYFLSTEQPVIINERNPYSSRLNIRLEAVRENLWIRLNNGQGNVTFNLSQGGSFENSSTLSTTGGRPEAALVQCCRPVTISITSAGGNVITPSRRVYRPQPGHQEGSVEFRAVNN